MSSDCYIDKKKTHWPHKVYNPHLARKYLLPMGYFLFTSRKSFSFHTPHLRYSHYLESFVCPAISTFQTSWEPMNRFLRDNLNIAKILSRSFCTYDGILFVCVMIGQQTWTMKEFLLGAGDLLYWEIEMNLGIYVHINVGTLMSIGNDRQ